MNIEGLSIKQLKALLSTVNADIKAAAPVLSKPIKADNEGIICNTIAQQYTGNKQVNTVTNKRLIQDIAIQHDILDYLNSGKTITCHVARKSKFKPIAPLIISSKRIISV